MKFAAWRLAAAAALFALWIGWLAYLAATTTKPVVLRRPQFLVSTVDVVAEVQEVNGGPSPAVTVSTVSYPAQDNKLEKQTITVSNIASCVGWAGPGSYILALTKNGDGYQVAPVPRSPGFPGEHSPEDAARPHIYPATPDTLAQLEEITRAKNDSTGGK